MWLYLPWLPWARSYVCQRQVQSLLVIAEHVVVIVTTKHNVEHTAGKLKALLANIWLTCYCVRWANTLAYCVVASMAKKKRFCNYEAFYGRNLWIFMIRPWQAFPAQSIVCGWGQELTLERSTWKVLHSGSLRLYLQTLDQAGKV
jgi:hypothetical protein